MSNLDQLANPVQFIDDERDQPRSDDDSDKEGEQIVTFNAQEQANMKANEILSTRDYGNYTGPKGVIADYNYFKQQKLKQATFRKESNLTKPIEEQRLINTEDSDSDDLDLDDDPIFEQYKIKRLNQLKNNTGGSNNTKKIFGFLSQLDINTFSQAIDTGNHGLTVIIHLFEPHLLNCQLVHKYLGELSTKYPLNRFGEIQASEVSSKFDSVVLPTLLVYRDGQLVLNGVRFFDNFNMDEPSLPMVEKFLLNQGLLDRNSQHLQ